MTPATSWADVRTALRENGVPDRAVLLPGDDGVPWEGSLVVADAGDRWALSTVDYGTARVLLRRSSAAEIVSALYQYALSPLPDPQNIPDAERERLLTWAAPHVMDLAARGVRDTVIDLPAGLLVDRIGALDGFLLYPTGTSFEARSLPVTALDQPLQSFLTTAPIRVAATVTPPWFGREGGGVRFAVQEASMGIRDLVREGQMRMVVPSSNPAAP
ncbi:hypothetical protein HDC37_000061 [Microbacterium sp. AK009]|uniref:TNT domain-containing protein n=1 Tax=Microbacterium sp. AK009 TaxID=2723068 RepID=UPI0015C774E0|nr:TNT domain-containing protein [Microbacterium sp. AK009]NYF15249.1 hypothetical protein [Microbacterium sp. AK009]